MIKEAWHAVDVSIHPKDLSSQCILVNYVFQTMWQQFSLYCAVFTFRYMVQNKTNELTCNYLYPLNTLLL